VRPQRMSSRRYRQSIVEIAIPRMHSLTLMHTNKVKLVGMACEANFMYCTITYI